MNKFLFKSTNADLQKLLQSIETIQKNILYLTYQSDRSLKLMTELTTDKGLQKQVDEYFEEGAEVGLEDTRTSLQTDTENNGPN